MSEKAKRKPAKLNMKSTAELIAEAKSQPIFMKGRRNTDKWVPVVDILRRKRWSFDKIWEWLKAAGEDVHEDPRKFASAMSTRYKRHLAKAAK